MKHTNHIIAALIGISVNLFSIHSAVAQTFTLTMTSDTIACGNPGDQIYVYGDITNTTASLQSLDIIRVENNIPVNWQTALCIDVCYTPTVDSVQVTFNANETKTFIFHFYTGVSADSGNALVKLKNVANPTETILQRFYGNTNCITGIVDNEPANRFNLTTYPNPVSVFTNIQFTILQTEDVTLTVYDITGKQIATLMNERKTAGTHSVLFDTQSLPAGTYFYQFRTSEFVQTNKMELIR